MTLCECGCGQETNIYRGRHNRFIRGHNNFGKQNALGHKHTDETKRKLSELGKGKTSGFKGMKHTEGTKRKISESNKGKNLGNQHSLGKKLDDEHKKKLSDICKGNKHYNWQGGVSFEPYCHKFNEQFKESVREKFNRKCLLCGKSEDDNKGRKLSVHHVQHNKNCGCDDSLTCDYVPLCMSCHSKVHNSIDKEYLEELILEKLHLMTKKMLP